MAALGELEFEMFGFLCQASAVIVSPAAGEGTTSQ
jgi:hypothetical protein